MVGFCHGGNLPESPLYHHQHHHHVNDEWGKMCCRDLPWLSVISPWHLLHRHHPDDDSDASMVIIIMIIVMDIKGNRSNFRWLTRPKQTYRRGANSRICVMLCYVEFSCIFPVHIRQKSLLEKSRMPHPLFVDKYQFWCENCAFLWRKMKQNCFECCAMCVLLQRIPRPTLPWRNTWADQNWDV